MDEVEFITHVAAIYKGEVYSLPKPNRHHDIIKSLYVGETIVFESSGFLTSKGRYVTREEALSIATLANQLLPRHFHKTQLFSESVW